MQKNQCVFFQNNILDNIDRVVPEGIVADVHQHVAGIASGHVLPHRVDHHMEIESIDRVSVRCTGIVFIANPSTKDILRFHSDAHNGASIP